MTNLHGLKLTLILCPSLFIASAGLKAQDNNLSLTGTAMASSEAEGFSAKNVLDGKANSLWQSSESDKNPWVIVRLPGATEIFKIGVKSGDAAKPIRDFKLQIMHNGNWQNVKQITENTDSKLSISLDKPVLSDRIRLIGSSDGAMELAELELFGQTYVDENAGEVKKILVNQSGYNLNRPKRFSAPDLEEVVDFKILSLPDSQEVFLGKTEKGIGDFSDFNPISDSEYIIEAKGFYSFPFRIGINWLERVTYRNIVDFMAGARHYVGTTDQICTLSWAWRDGDFFNWALQSLVSLYLSNPAAFDRMERTINYVPNSDFSEKYQGKWGALEPYSAEAPDLVKLIHWDADVKISQQLDHEMQKAELSYFLYAWPYLSKWLPKQNFDRVYAYLKETWTKPGVSDYSTTKYDLSPEHNLLSLKTKLGTTKGELPPGHSVIPNLLMYQVAKSMNEPDAEKYFDAAFRQLEWMIKNLDWNDPMTTKGQRMSEHITMRAFAFFYQEYPDRAPAGLQNKVTEWSKVAVSRADNYWDFRKYSEEEWTPPSWNETGNVLGFPAAAFSAMSVLGENKLSARLEELAWAHVDNSFGRNPTGRHFSYRGPDEIEGVDLGWYSYHKGGIGQLDEVKFVFDGSPKSFHYPNHPEVGNLGWTEGWVQFNTAFNLSMAYMAEYYTQVELIRDGKKLRVKLIAPMNFDYAKDEPVEVFLENSEGDRLKVLLHEISEYSDELNNLVKIKRGKLVNEFGELSISGDQTVSVSYGLGFMKNTAKIKLD